MPIEPRKSNPKSKKSPIPPARGAKRAAPGARAPKAKPRGINAAALGNFEGDEVAFDAATGRITLKNADLRGAVLQFLDNPVEGCFSGLFRVGPLAMPAAANASARARAKAKGGAIFAEDDDDAPVVVDARC